MSRDAFFLAFLLLTIWPVLALAVVLWVSFQVGVIRWLWREARAAFTAAEGRSDG